MKRKKTVDLFDDREEEDKGARYLAVSSAVPVWSSTCVDAIVPEVVPDITEIEGG